jgi:rSAM/selenodomain-associated transferase 1
MLRRHVVIFARRPQLGVGKRRLAKDVGNVEALRFTRSTIAQLVRTLGRDPRWSLWIAATPDRPTAWTGDARVVPQGRGSLGERLSSVAKRLPRGAVIFLGSDLPTVSRRDVARAFAALAGKTAVFGPASDGGYWLIGLRRRPRLILPFDGVRWSTPHALADTVARLNGAPHAMLDEREDVDDGAALRRLVTWRRARTCAGRSPQASSQGQDPKLLDL